MKGLKDLMAKLVVDNLDSNSTNSPLSARCGKTLQKEIISLNEKLKELEKKVGG